MNDGAIYTKWQTVFRALTRKLQLGPPGPNWESEHSKHAGVSASKYSWEVWGVL